MFFFCICGYKCLFLVFLIFGFFFVMCKIFRNILNNGVVLIIDGLKDGFRLEFEVYYGEEYLEEEYFVCVVMLFRFVYGIVLNEILLII